MVTIFLAILLAHETGKPQKAYVVPVAIEDESDPRTFMADIMQIEIDNDLLYVRQNNSTEILVFDRQLKFLFSVGGRGGGPGEFQVNLSGFSVWNGALWLYEVNDRLSYFQGPDHIRDIPIKGLQVGTNGESTDAFAFDENVILLSAHPRTRHLGLVYDYQGNVLQGVGKIFPINQDELQRNPAYNDVLWIKGGEYWYAVFEYHPLIQKFDSHFVLVDEFSFKTQALDEYLELVGNWKPKKRWRIPPEMITDAKWHDRHLWVMCFGALLKIDTDDGHLLNAWHFFGKGEDYPQNTRLHFKACDLFSDHQILIIPPVTSRGSVAFTFNME